METVCQSHKHEGQHRGDDRLLQAGGENQSAQTRAHLFVALVTLVLLFFMLLFPDHPEKFTLLHFARLPLELPLFVLAILLFRGTAQKMLRYLLVAVLGLAVLLRTADIGSRLAFDRRFSPLLEWHLLGDGWNLASQQLGRVEAGLFVVLAIVLIVGLGWVLYTGLGIVGRFAEKARRNVGLFAAGLLIIGLPSLFIQEAYQLELGVQASLVPELIDRHKALQRSIIDQQVFVAQLAVDPVDLSTPPGFAALSGRDIAFVFIESYGQSFLTDEDFGQGAAERLTIMESEIAAAGLHARSGWMTSPVRGGRSWLTHASFASGLEINNQARFDRLVASDRVSLYSLFGKAGWHTVGVVPAIREAWPEGVWYGFDRIYDFQRMGYEGQPFGWVTMPDQFTLSAFEHDIRRPYDRPVMAEIALISSHAPWTPIPTLVPWESVGDGSVFDGTHRFGEPMTWKDRSRVREMYAKSLHYSLAAVSEYLSRYGKGALFVIHGDHQPASIIAGWGKTADVPIHIVSDDPALLDRLPSDVFTPGMLPKQASRSLPMWSMRELMSQAFETTGEPVIATP